MKLKSRSVLISLLVLLSLIWVLPRLRNHRRPSPDANPFKFSSSYQQHTGVFKEYGLVSPNFYEYGDKVDITVNKVESDLTHFSYGYYDLHFTCPPSQDMKPLPLTFSDILYGNKKWQSDYQLTFGKDEDCVRLCDRKTNGEGKKQAYQLIKQNYVVQWLADDDLPGATTYLNTKDKKKYYSSGFPLGHYNPETDEAYINNHVMIVIRYHTIDQGKNTIVGFEVYPKSVSDHHCPGASKDYAPYKIDPTNEDIEFISFTYAVYWREDFKVDWKNRWNFFINGGELKESTSNQFHWITFANGIIVTSCLLLIVIAILKRQETDGSITTQLAAEWSKARVPLFFQLNLLVSMGIHFLFTTLGTLIISCSLNHTHRIGSSVLTCAVFLFISGGFTSSFIGALLEGQMSQHKLVNSIIFGSSLPGITLVIVLLLNYILNANNAANTLPHGTVAFLFGTYFIVCVPISIIGGKCADRFLKVNPTNTLLNSFALAEVNKHDTRPLYVESKNSIPFVLKNPIAITLTFGLIPFALIYVELLFAYKSLWLQKTTLYYLYGFLLSNIVIVCICICLLSIIGCYIHLNYGNDSLNFKWDNVIGRVLEACHSWRWKAFHMGGAVAWYMEAYSIFYLIFVARYRDFISSFLFVCYSTLFNILCWTAFGSLSYLSSLWFIGKLNEYNKAK
ncbi:Tmn3 [Kluyveromyces lactis]|nr:Tmn3 [Kluyveromyces lactis]